MSSLYLIRHGQASFGTEDYDRLSEIGKRQAVVTGEYFQDRGVRFDAIYSGDLRRHRDTADRIATAQSGGLDVNVDARFDEIHLEQQIKVLSPLLRKENASIDALLTRGLKESKDYQKVIEAVFKFWIENGDKHPDIESWQAFSSRCRTALQEVVDSQRSGKTIAIVSSGGTIATMISGVLGLSDLDTYKLYEPMLNCAVSELFYNQTKISVSSFNDYSFLDVLGRQTGESLITYR